MNPRIERVIFRIYKKLRWYSPSEYHKAIALKDLQAGLAAMNAIQPEINRRVAQELARRTQEKLNEQGT